MSPYREGLVRHYRDVRRRLVTYEPAPKHELPPEPERPFDLEAALLAFVDALPTPPPQPSMPARMTAVAVMRATAWAMGLKYEDVVGASRTKNIAFARQIGMYLCMRLLPPGPSRSYPQLGRRFHRDHTSVLHAVRKITRLAAECPEQNRRLREIEFEVRAMLPQTRTMELEDGQHDAKQLAEGSGHVADHGGAGAGLCVGGGADAGAVDASSSAADDGQ